MSAPTQGALCAEPRKAPDELPWEKGHLWIEKHHLNTVARRVTPLDVLLLEFIDCYTRSAALKVVDTKGNRRRPEFGQIPTDWFVRFTGASERNINLRLSFLEKIAYIARERPKAETHRGGYKTLPENFRKRALPAPKPKRECRPKTAEQRGPRDLAALDRQPPAGSPVEQPPADPSLEEKIGRMVLLSIAESGKVPSVAEIAATHGIAVPAAAPAAAEPPVQQPAAQPESRQGWQDAPPPAAEVPQGFAAWAATHCRMAALCPFVHRPADGSPTEPEPEPIPHTVGRQAQTPAGACLPTETAPAPELEPELAAIAASIPERLCAKLGDLPGRSLLELIREGLAGAPAVPWLTRAIERAEKRMGSMGMLAHRTPDGRIEGLAADASAAWKRWQEAAGPSPEPDRSQQEYAERELMLEYMEFRERTARAMLDDLGSDARRERSAEKRDWLKRDGRWHKMAPEIREGEVDDLILQDLARDHMMPFTAWRRNRGSQ